MLYEIIELIDKCNKETLLDIQAVVTGRLEQLEINKLNCGCNNNIICNKHWTKKDTEIYILQQKKGKND